MQIIEDLNMQLKNANSTINELTMNSKGIPSDFQNQSKDQQSTMNYINKETIQSFEKFQKLGNGSNGTSFDVVKKEHYVLKEIDNLCIQNVPSFIEEYKNLNSSFNHPNILKNYGIFKGDGKTPSSILMEKCLCNIQQLIENKKLSKVDASFAIYQIAEGMKFIHFNKIIHRNLKPSNVLVCSDGTIKISDIGINRLTVDDDYCISMKGSIESLYFIAPEILSKQICNEKVDVYSFGVLVYFILSGGEIPNLSVADLIRGKKIQTPPNFTSCGKEIVDFCCNPNPQNRPSFNEIVDYLKNDKCILLNLSKIEIQDVQNRIKEHQKRIQTI